MTARPRKESNMRSKRIEGKALLCRAIAAAFALGVAAPAAAQFEEKTCLVLDSAFAQTIRISALTLGFKEAVSAVSSETLFVSSLQSKQWNLIGIERSGNKVVNKEVILDLFKQQAAGGAKFIISYAHLDEWPELQEFMGVASAVDLTKASDVEGKNPGNPVFSGGGFNGTLSSGFSDHGDVLTPLPGTIAVAEFIDGPSVGEVAAVMHPDRTRLCCGFNLDEYEFVPIFEVMRFIEVMILCEDDANFDGVVDVSDFQQLFNWIVSQSTAANRNYDDSIDIFDFLHFFNNWDPNCVP